MSAMIAKLVNLALLGLFPIAWQMPLARADVAWIFTAEEISIFSGIVELWESDTFLCVVVALFAVITPYLKTLALVYVQFSETDVARRALPVLEFLGRLSMTDVFLVAFYIIAYRGVGDIIIEDGLYLFTGLVLASIWASWATRRRLFHLVPRAAGPPPIVLSQGARPDPLTTKRLPSPHSGPQSGARGETG